MARIWRDLVMETRTFSCELKNSIMKASALVSGQLIGNPYLSVALSTWICNRIDPSLGPLSGEGR